MKSYNIKKYSYRKSEALTGLKAGASR